MKQKYILSNNRLLTDNFTMNVNPEFVLLQGEDAGHTRNSSNTSSRSQGSAGYMSQSSQQSGQAHSRHSSEDSAHNRNPSSGSADTGIYTTGSMEKDKRRKKLDGGRVDAEDVINELMEDIQIENMAVQEGKMSVCWL